MDLAWTFLVSDKSDGLLSSINGPIPHVSVSHGVWCSIVWCFAVDVWQPDTGRHGSERRFSLLDNWSNTVFVKYRSLISVYHCLPPLNILGYQSIYSKSQGQRMIRRHPYYAVKYRQVCVLVYSCYICFMLLLLLFVHRDRV